MYVLMHAQVIYSSHIFHFIKKIKYKLFTSNVIIVHCEGNKFIINIKKIKIKTEYEK